MRVARPRVNRGGAHSTPEQRKRAAERYKQRRHEARDAGLCTNCLKRPVATRAWWWKEDDRERVMRSCEICLEADYWRARQKAANATWCEECLAFGFHRSHCPNLDTSDNPTLARIEKKLLDLELQAMVEREKPVGLSPPHHDEGSEARHPGIVEDGRPSDEGGPESNPDEIDFPGLPRLKPPPSEAHVDKGKTDGVSG